MTLGFAGKLFRRKQLTIGGMLVAIALLAIVINWLRPISGFEAARIAEKRFRTIPGSSDWAGRYQARPRFADGGNGRHYWVVNIVDVRSDEPLAQVSLDPRGNLESVIVSLRSAPPPNSSEPSATPTAPQSPGERPTQ